jgi:hypothetical protein
MFTRITWLDFRSRRSDEAFEILDRAVMPTMKQLPGCQGVLLLRDPRSGSATLITLWDGRREAEQLGGLSERHLSLLYETLAGTPAEDVYEVREASI